MSAREQLGRRLFQVLAAVSPILSAGTESDEVQSWCGAIEASFVNALFAGVVSEGCCAVCTDYLGGHLNKGPCSSACSQNSAFIASQPWDALVSLVQLYVAAMTRHKGAG